MADRAALNVARAASDIGRAVPVLIEGGASHNFLIVAAELAGEAQLNQLRAISLGSVQCWLTHARAADLKLRLYTANAVAVVVAPDMPADALRALADPGRDLGRLWAGPYETLRADLGPAAGAVMSLMKLAGVLPAALAAPLAPAKARALARDPGFLKLRAEDIVAFPAGSDVKVELITQARVPLALAERCQILAFRETASGREHLAIRIGEPAAPGPVLVRLHSACLTGDLLDSLKCDCGVQLKGAIAALGREPSGGLLLYLAQEGRGIGLLNKLRAYRLQDQGFDTVEANIRLGFKDDERDFAAAAAMLNWLGVRSVRLMTNNPAKIEGLKALGIDVGERVAHQFAPNPHNAAYLAAKAKKSGHLLD